MKTMKKTLSLFIAVIMVIFFIPMTATAIYTDTDGYYTYEISGGKATITDVFTPISGDIVIPDTLGGYPVTRIGTFAFSDCYNLTSVTIPNCVTSIGADAFSGCSRLMSVTIPDSVTEIDFWAFEDCTSLASITIPDSVTSIGGAAFRGCTSLTNVLIPDSVVSIGRYTFAGCSNLTSINVSENNTAYKSIDGVLFSKDGMILFQYPIGNTNAEYTIPDGVLYISEYAFYCCSNLTSITISNSVTGIGNSAFFTAQTL